MRYLLTILFFSCGYGIIQAQPLLTGPVNNPVAGDAFCRHTCGVTGISLGSIGAAVVWDFSALSTINTDTVTYLACHTTPECDSFPGSTLAVSRAGFYNYYVTDTGRMALTGDAFSTGNTYYDTPENIMVYPMHYSDIKNAGFAYHQPATSSFEYGSASFFADAYGTLILPTGTYNNVLRIHQISNYTDSTITSGGPALTSYRRDTYLWYTPGFRSPLLAAYYDIDILGVPELAQVYYYTQTVTGITNYTLNEQDIKLYPNPATDNLFLQLQLPAASSATTSITDILGRAMNNPKFMNLPYGRQTISIPIQMLPTGIYLLKWQTNSTIRYLKFAVER